ncbi:MAG TPA: response regulator [Kofleriaceae bacterium]|jgi:DNA-binding response OmpR family regulator
MTRPRRILLVEDDRALRGLLARHLRRHGFEVIDVRDGIAALGRLGDELYSHRGDEFDLLISDIRMPGHSGLELTSELRRSAWTLPILLITAFGSDETHETAAQLHASILDKPIDLDQLTATVERLLS